MEFLRVYHHSSIVSQFTIHDNERLVKYYCADEHCTEDNCYGKQYDVFEYVHVHVHSSSTKNQAEPEGANTDVGK
jgi:hypothetical protein